MPGAEVFPHESPLLQNHLRCLLFLMNSRYWPSFVNWSASLSWVSFPTELTFSEPLPAKPQLFNRVDSRHSKFTIESDDSSRLGGSPETWENFGGGLF